MGIGEIVVLLFLASAGLALLARGLAVCGLAVPLRKTDKVLPQ